MHTAASMRAITSRMLPFSRHDPGDRGHHVWLHVDTMVERCPHVPRELGEPLGAACVRCTVSPSGEGKTCASRHDVLSGLCLQAVAAHTRCGKRLTRLRQKVRGKTPPENAGRAIPGQPSPATLVVGATNVTPRIEAGAWIAVPVLDPDVHGRPPGLPAARLTCLNPFFTVSSQPHGLRSRHVACRGARQRCPMTLYH